MESSDIISINFILSSSVDIVYFCGVYDSNLRFLERNMGIHIYPTPDGSFLIKGDNKIVLSAKKVMQEMVHLCNGKIPITHRDIKILIEKNYHENHEHTISPESSSISKTMKIKAYTKNQEEYIKKIFLHDIVFAIGPAGTGKTYISIAAALDELKKGNVKKIILTRPVVETDEHLGFLPGTLEEKIDPYIRPLYDAIYDMISQKEFEKLSANGQIELAPLAYMRGRTLIDSVIILDEAQNTTINQMKMFLTRLGRNSKMIINGDVTQIDLSRRTSGLVHVLEKIQNIEGIAVHIFEKKDTVRHNLVQKIIDAYES